MSRDNATSVMFTRRKERAEAHLACFMLCVENGLHDQVTGQQAQNALEYALKALLEAHGATYNNTRNLRELLANVRRNDPRMEGFSLDISPELYSEYVGKQRHQDQRSEPLLTDQPNYAGLTIDGVERILNRAEAARIAARPRAGIREPS